MACAWQGRCVTGVNAAACHGAGGSWCGAQQPRPATNGRPPPPPAPQGPCHANRALQTCRDNPLPRRPPANMDLLCPMPCIKELLKCANEPADKQPYVLGDGERQRRFLKTLLDDCHHKDKHAHGDGHCNADDLVIHRQKLHGKIPDCDTHFLQELFDCKDNAHVVGSQDDRDKLAGLEHICKTKCSNERQKRLNAKDGGKRSMCDVPGDGICNIREVASYQAFYQVFGHSQKPGCKSKMILEMFDCIDDPLFSMGGQVLYVRNEMYS